MLYKKKVVMSQKISKSSLQTKMIKIIVKKYALGYINSMKARNLMAEVLSKLSHSTIGQLDYHQVLYLTRIDAIFSELKDFYLSKNTKGN